MTVSSEIHPFAHVVPRETRGVRKTARAAFWRKDVPEMDDNGRIIKGGLWEHQRKWWDLNNFVRVLVGGYGCVAAETVINGVPIAERRAIGEVGTIWGASLASPAYLKGQAELYRVTTRSGREVVVTLAHRFLTPNGWRQLAELSIGRLIGGVYEDGAGMWDEVTNIAFVRFGDFYDLTVPGAEHYEAHGLWHHNSGKTNPNCKRTIALALENAPCPVAIVSPTFPQARLTTIPTLEELLTGKRNLYGRDFYWRRNKQLNHFVIRYRGRKAMIQVYSGERPNALKGPNLAAACIDEPFIQDEEVFKQMVARVRHPDAKRLEINLTGTPEQLNWGYDLCYGELREAFDVGVVHARTSDNRAIKPDYEQRLLRSLSEEAAAGLVAGQFVNLSTGLVYYGFSPERNVAELEMPEGAILGFGIDFNVNPMSAAVFWKHREHVHFIEELELPNADTEYLCSILREKYWEQGLRESYPDASGQQRSTSAPGGRSDFHYIRDAGFAINAPHKNPLRRDRYNAVNGALKPSVGRPKVTISRKCKKLIRYLQTYSHELLHKQEAFSHLLDAFSYPVSRIHPVDRRFHGEKRITGY